MVRPVNLHDSIETVMATSYVHHESLATVAKLKNLGRQFPERNHFYDSQIREIIRGNKFLCILK